MLKILLHGEPLKEGMGTWCYAETLKQMGHTVIPYHYYENIEFYHRSLLWRAVRKINLRNLWEPHRLLHVGGLLKKVRETQPDIVIIAKGLFFSREDIDQIKQEGAWVVNINHDDFFSKNINNHSAIQRAALPAYDYLFTTREVNVAELKPYNPNVAFFMFSYYPAIHKEPQLTAEEAAKWQTDVLFVGSRYAHRTQLLTQLVNTVKADYAIYGPQWDKLSATSPLAKYVKNRPIYGEDMAKAMRAAKITLGFLAKENRDDYTQRTFEIPACGGVMLIERTARHLAFYQEGIEAEFFDADSADELCQKVQFLLDNDAYREAMRKAGHEALQRQPHTYRNRLEQLIGLYFAHRRPEAATCA